MALRWHEHVLGFCVKHGNLQVNENRKSAKSQNGKAESRKVICRGGVIRSSDEVTVMVMEQRDDIISLEIREQLGKTGGFDERKQTIRYTKESSH